MKLDPELILSHPKVIIYLKDSKEGENFKQIINDVLAEDERDQSSSKSKK